MRIEIMLEAQFGLNWERWKDILRVVEDSGYDLLFRSDHYVLTQPPDQDSLELWISLTYAASHTRRIEFGPMVAPVTFRQPVLTAKMGAQVDDLSGGRLVLALGAGWCEREHTMFGIPFYDVKTRIDMFEEALEITHLLYDHNEPVSFQGKHFELHDAVLLPRPQRPGGPPILVGGGGPKRTIPLAARYADEWNAFAAIDVFKEKSALLNQHLRKEGRQPEDVRRSISTNTALARNDADLKTILQKRDAELTEALWQRGNTVGTTSELIDRCQQWQEAGVDRLLLQWLDLDDLEGLEIIARDVLPHFHQG